MTSIIKKESVKYGNTAYIVLKMSQKDFDDMNRYISTRIANILSLSLRAMRTSNSLATYIRLIRAYRALQGRYLTF